MFTDAVYSFPYSESTKTQISDLYFKFKLEGCDAVLGYVLPHIVHKLPPHEIWRRDDSAKVIIFNPIDVPSDPELAVEHRTRVFAEYLQSVREANVFLVLKGWRDEQYPVYGPKGTLLFGMERSASALFGIVTFGVHMTAYTQTAEGMKIWIPQRSLTKSTYPGMMDNTVAGGIAIREHPFECLVRESMEEASIPESIARTAQTCGTITYFHIRDDRAGGEVDLCQPECQYIYDLVLPADFVPRPGDDEAINFQHLGVEEVQKAMSSNQFKPNCALVLVDFFVRHGIITIENEPAYLDVVPRLHRRLEFSMGHP